MKLREDIIDVIIISKSETKSDYSLILKRWTSTEMDIKILFDNPLLVSQKDLDTVNCEIVNPFLFVSKATGDYISSKTEYFFSSLIPKQMPEGVDGESM